MGQNMDVHHGLVTGVSAATTTNSPSFGVHIPQTWSLRHSRLQRDYNRYTRFECVKPSLRTGILLVYSAPYEIPPIAADLTGPTLA